MSAEGSGSTPPTPATNTNIPPISSFLAPTPPGMRYPLYAAVQGSPLLYSPAIFSQAMFPWRAMATPGTVISASTTQSQPSPSHLVTQLPGLVYPLPTLGMPMLATHQQGGSSSDVKQTNIHQVQSNSELGKRRTEGHSDVEAKRPRLSESTPHSPYYHTPSPSPKLVNPTTPNQTTQRSPVIKFIPYNPGQTIVIPSGISQATSTTSLPQAVIVAPTAVQPQGSDGTQQQQRVVTMTTAYKVPNASSTPTPPTIALPSDLSIMLLKCFGPIPESIISQNRLVVSNMLQDLYRPSYFTTSNYSDPPLSPESCALLTICYLNSLRPGEVLNVENLRTMMHYAQLGEIEWLHYYKKHKNMSESTFVQSQLMHLSRIAVYPVMGKVRVMISCQNLGDGITLTLNNLAQLISISKQSLPDYVVVLAIRPSATIDFCVLVLNSLQVQLLRELQHQVLVVEVNNKRVSRWRDSRRKLQEVQNVPEITSIQIDRELLSSMRSFQRKLAGEVFIPFHSPSSNPSPLPRGHAMNNIHMAPSVAESIVPSTSHVIEHKPKGPFQDQYGVAMYMLQKLMNSWGSNSKIEEFKRIDFRVLCPSEESFTSQMIGQVAESRLVEYLELAGEGTTVSEEVRKRVICCNSDESTPKFTSFLEEVKTNQKTLYIIIAENGHLTTSVARQYPEKNNSTNGFVSDSKKLLCWFSNCLLVYVSSQPFILQTNRPLVTYANEIHWPRWQHHPKGGAEKRQFCSASDYCSKVWDYGTSFREDQLFEQLFQETCANNSKLSSTNLTALRTQLLINEYTAALLAAVGCYSNHRASLPETQQIVNSLVFDPLSSSKGYGPMVIVRSHDMLVGRKFYQKLRAVRDALGLKYRFEIIFDDGSQVPTISEHFSKRHSQWVSGRGGCHGNQSSGHVTSYKQLENLPCVLVLVGLNRAGLTFPSSLHYVDLRLCYCPLVTRAVYEYDTSLLNGYHLGRPVASLDKSTKTTDEGATEVMETNGDSDCEVFEDSKGVEPVGVATSRDKAPPLIRASSSSSSRKSSYCGEECQEPNEDANKTKTVVEWRPDSEPNSIIQKSDSNSRPDGGSETAESDADIHVVGNEIHGAGNEIRGGGNEICGMDNEIRQTVTVTIDPPEDQPMPNFLSNVNGSHSNVDGFHSDVDESHPNIVDDSHSDVDGSHSHNSSIPFQRSSSVESELDLYAGLDDSECDSEGEECDNNIPTRVCLLSRPYYLIWSSRSPQQHLLLPPALGVDWHGGHKRPPLFDPDPHQQSAYYRKWTKPSEKEVKLALDAIMKEASRGARRRFLLTGPPQVGKTGAWLLFVQLLHDHIRSSQGVVVVNEPIPRSIFLQTADNTAQTNGGEGTALVSVSAPPSFSIHSRIVSMEYLRELSKQIQAGEREKATTLAGDSPKTTFESPFQQATLQNETRHTISLSIPPSVAYDFTHSCTDCSKYLRGSPVAHPEILTSVLPTEQGHITIQWHVPTYQQKYCVISPDRRSLERLKLPTLRLSTKEKTQSLTSVFTMTLGRDSTGLLNLFHTLTDRLHVLVTSSGQFEKYCKAWPNHIVMALPDEGTLAGLGRTYHLVKHFLQYTYQLNEAMLQYEGAHRIVWPLVLLMSDSCVMWKKIAVDGGRTTDMSLTDVIRSFEQHPDCLKCAAMSLLTWNKELEDDIPTPLTDYDLNHSFIILNLPTLTNIHYSSFSYNSAHVDFNLHLKAAGLRTKLHTDMAFVKKHVPTGGNPYPMLNGLCADADKLVISLHHDSSSLLHYPGAYLMEHFLLHKSSSVFPSSQRPQHPVLVVDNYINLGPNTNVMFLKSEELQSRKQDVSEEDGIDGVHFGGLLLYLCEGKVASDRLHGLNFVPNASLCLVTRDCKSLVREASRLDMEERWKFRLKDEFQTACHDNLRPLFFLMGRFRS